MTTLKTAVWQTSERETLSKTGIITGKETEPLGEAFP